MENKSNSSENQEVKKISVPFTYKYILIDIVLRFLVLWLFIVLAFYSWLFWIFHILIIPLITLILILRTNKEEEIKTFLLKKIICMRTQKSNLM
jgi:hypothetical protein